MDEISLSVDETNQLRLSLGLAPLVIEEAAAEQPKRQASPDQASRNERLIENIKRQKARAFTTSGSGLGSGTSESSLEFIKRLSSGNKGKTAPKMTAKDSKLSALAGLDSNVHISKAVVDNVDNVDTILVLKDQTLAENDSHGDTLTTLRANKVQNDVKQYNPYDEHSSLLEQYNEPALEETVVMTLGSRAEIAQTAQKEAPVKNAVSLDYDKSRIQKDYNPSLAFKPRKIKRKKTNFRAIVPDDELVAPGDYSNAGNQLARTNFVDDDDLQTAIAQSRRQYVAPLLMNLSSDDEAEGITLLDSNLLAVGSRVADVQHIEKTEEKISPNDMIIDHQQDQDVDMLVASVKQEPLDEPMTPDQPNMAEHAAIEPEILVSKTGGASGIGAALKLLMQHGDLKPANSTQVESQSTSSRRQEWAERQRAHTEKREMELRASKARNKALGGRATHVNRTEWDTKNDLLVEKQLKYRDYVPDVKLQYTDEKGRILTTKEVSTFNPGIQRTSS